MNIGQQLLVYRSRKSDRNVKTFGAAQARWTDDKISRITVESRHQPQALREF